MKSTLLSLSLCLLPMLTQADLITSVPGPDDQGGMIMPMFRITNADNNLDPTTGTVSVMFNPTLVPEMKPIESWSPGSWFAPSAAWRSDLGSAEGVGGTPTASAGSGDLFNSQYGLMFMADPMMGSAFVPTGKSLGIRLTAISSPEMEVYNYSSGNNRWDSAFSSINSQVLWNGSMWHSYFTLPGDAPAGTYTATFEVFVANGAFSSGTGFVDYSPTALAATQDANFTSAFVDFTWVAVPEPSTVALIVMGLGFGLAVTARNRFGKRAAD